MSCKCFNPIVSLHVNSNHKINNRLTRAIGVNMPKGLIVVAKGLSLSKDGIYDLLRDYSCSNMLLARLIGIFDFIATTLLLPFTLIIYTFLFILGLVSWLFLWPCAIGLWKKNLKFRAYMTFVGMAIPLAPLTMIVAVILVPLSALQIIVPELTALVLHIHLWGTTERVIFG